MNQAGTAGLSTPQTRAELARTFAILIDPGLRPEWQIDGSYTARGLSGSLRRSDGSHRLELFDGFDPILSEGVHLVG